MQTSTPMATLKLQFHGISLRRNPQIPSLSHSQHTFTISCGLRSRPRKPIWRGRVLSTEAIQAVQFLKLAKNSSSRLELVFRDKLSRLLKADLLDTLAELQRQKELDLALEVFSFVRKEPWYVPDITLFNDVMMMLGKYKMIGMVEQLYSELKNEGLEPDIRTYTELIGAYFKVELVNRAMETYELMKASGFTPDELTLMILIRNLEKLGEEALAEIIKKECSEYFDYPEKFLQEVQRKYAKRKSLIVI